MENIFITYDIEFYNKQLVIQGDQHSIWAYVYNVEGTQNTIELDAFICSTGTIVQSSKEIKNYLESGFAPPLAKGFENKHSVIAHLEPSDFRVNIIGSKIEIYVTNKLYSLIDLETMTAYSISVSKNGPYGQTLSTDNKN